jgi:hypothetical protein
LTPSGTRRRHPLGARPRRPKHLRSHLGALLAERPSRPLLVVALRNASEPEHHALFRRDDRGLDSSAGVPVCRRRPGGRGEPDFGHWRSDGHASRSIRRSPRLCARRTQPAPRPSPVRAP